MNQTLITEHPMHCPCCGRSHRLSYLLALYEQNFRRLQRLIPDIARLPSEAVSRSPRDLPLHLQVASRDRYAALLKLSYTFVDTHGVRRHPDLWVQVYQDAQVAEAQECSQRVPWEASGEGDPRIGAFLNAQWQRNILLGKWLEYLLARGHGFFFHDVSSDAVSDSMPNTAGSDSAIA
jgi:uncharacterized protein